MITERDYILAEEEYVNLTHEELGELAQKAADAQPALFTFVATAYEYLEEDDNKEFFIQLIYSTWIAYNNKYEQGRTLSVKEIEKMDEYEVKRSNALPVNDDIIFREALIRTALHPQSELMGYLYRQIGDFFQLEQPEAGDPANSAYQDAFITSRVLHSFVNLLESTRQLLNLS